MNKNIVQQIPELGENILQNLAKISISVTQTLFTEMILSTDIMTLFVPLYHNFFVFAYN